VVSLGSGLLASAVSHTGTHVHVRRVSLPFLRSHFILVWTSFASVSALQCFFFFPCLFPHVFLSSLLPLHSRPGWGKGRSSAHR
jgi:hypothetical protein